MRYPSRADYHTLDFASTIGHGAHRPVSCPELLLSYGNTSAAVLTDTLAPEEPADLRLLLGCGDLRNVLFTPYSQADSSECWESGSYLSGSPVDFKPRDHWTSLVAMSNLPCWVDPLSRHVKNLLTDKHSPLALDSP